MCGIVGYVGSEDAVPVLLRALRRLEYRGYDSAGVATLDGGRIGIRRAVGKLGELERRLAREPLSGTIGIGHTRWATHGRVSEENAHPHRAGRVVVIHNGIVENYLELREELTARGRRFESETDTEVIAHLIDEGVEAGLGLAEATRAAVRRLQGSFAIVAMADREPGRLVAAKTATPIVIGLGQGENLVASDVPALLDRTRDVIFLEDGEIAEITRDGVTVTGFDGSPRERAPRHVAWDPVTAQKGGHRHFLAKEIHEQPQALIDTLRGRVRPDRGEVVLPELDDLLPRLDRVERISLVACGTAWHACLVGKFYLNGIARLPAEADYASEFRYRDPVLGERDLVVAVSQSGETADTLGALEEARRRRVTTLAVVNVMDSSIARRADAVIYTHAGPEVSVCSTKAFTTQLAVLFLLAVFLGRRRGVLDPEGARGLLGPLQGVAALVEQALGTAPRVERIARGMLSARDVLYLGRGIHYPIALEGALKLKEISYVHAEGYPAGEMKHGPIALVTSQVPVVVLAPQDALFPKTLSNLREVESRGGRILAITDGAAPELEAACEHVLVVPRTHPWVSPFVFAVPLQLLAYSIAVGHGTDVDQPRNLAKSVTVE